MSQLIEPTSLDELVAAVRQTPRLLPVGAGTKPRLTAVDVPKLSLRGLRGIVEYEPDEFTFTARAGTPVHELAAALAARGQYLPFDPLLLAAGATLGGTVASGLNGPGRLRYGGLRDFILGVRFVDGTGRLLRLGGKVVKNAAGFDLPKFFVGSLGRFGVLAELTFKVFPRPEATRTLRLDVTDAGHATQLLLDLARGRWEPEALDHPPGGGVYVRLSAAEAALPALAEEILGRWPGAILSATEAERFWEDLREFRWIHPDGWLGKVILHPQQFPALQDSVARRSKDDARIHLSSGGNLAYVSLAGGPPDEALDAHWSSLGLRGLSLRGAGPLWVGERSETQIHAAVKHALDPQQRFPDLFP